MPMLDMRVALENPYTVDYFSVIRRVEVVNSFGESTLTTTTFANIAGVVVPAPPSALDRQANTQVASKWIDIISMFEFRSASESSVHSSYQPDIIQWKGSNYLVTTLGDYSSYGPGFTVAGCALCDSLATPPGDAA